MIVEDSGPMYVGKLLGMRWRPCSSVNSFSIGVLVFGAVTLALKSPCMHMSSSSVMSLAMFASAAYACFFSSCGFETSNAYVLSTCNRVCLLVIVIQVIRSVWVFR